MSGLEIEREGWMFFIKCSSRQHVCKTGHFTPCVERERPWMYRHQTTCKACKTVVLRCDICKFVTFLSRSRPFLLKLPVVKMTVNKLNVVFFWRRWMTLYKWRIISTRESEENKRKVANNNLASGCHWVCAKALNKSFASSKWGCCCYSYLREAWSLLGHDWWPGHGLSHSESSTRPAVGTESAHKQMFPSCREA